VPDVPPGAHGLRPRGFARTKSQADKARGVASARHSVTKQEKGGTRMLLVVTTSDVVTSTKRKDVMNETKFMTTQPLCQTNKPLCQTNKPRCQTDKPLCQTNAPRCQTDKPLCQTNAPQFCANQEKPPLR
jgi:hypothetical protein